MTAASSDADAQIKKLLAQKRKVERDLPPGPRRTARLSEIEYKISLVLNPPPELPPLPPPDPNAYSFTRKNSWLRKGRAVGTPHRMTMITTRDKQRAAPTLRKWIGSLYEKQDNKYDWAKAFARIEDVLVKTRPNRPTLVFRSLRDEHALDENGEGVITYDRFTSWSLRWNHGFSFTTGATLVRALVDPNDIVASIADFGPRIDVDQLDEVILRPGSYRVVKTRKDGLGLQPGWPDYRPTPLTPRNHRTGLSAGSVRTSARGVNYDLIDSWTRPGYVYRGITEEEFEAHRARGCIKSNMRWSAPHEGTCFGNDACTGESYANLGSTDPRRTGKPTFLIEVPRAAARFAVDSRDGYSKTRDCIPLSSISRIWRMDADGDDIVARLVDATSGMAIGRGRRARRRK